MKLLYQEEKFILHYFGEEFDNVSGEGGNMDDNARFPKEKIEAKDELLILQKQLLKQAKNISLKKLLKFY